MKFPLFGIPVRVHPLFWLTVFFIGDLATRGHNRRAEAEQASETAAWLGSAGAVDWLHGVLVWAAVILTGVLAHELGHALLGKVFGLSPRIDLMAFGGLTSWRGMRRRLTPFQSILVSMAGPGVGITIGSLTFAALVLARPDDALVYFGLLAVLEVNLFWGLLNLIPMLPLDGGNVVASLGEMAAGSRGRVAARVFSLFFAVAVIALLLAVENIIMALLVAFLAYQNWRGLRVERELGDDLALVDQLVPLYAALEAQQGRLLVTGARAVAKQAKTPRVREEAVRLLAWGHYYAGEPERAIEVLNEVPEGARREPGLYGAAMLDGGNPAGALRHLREAFARGPGAFAEGKLAEAYARTGFYRQATETFDDPSRLTNADALHALSKSAFIDSHFVEAAQLGQTAFEVHQDWQSALLVANSWAHEGDLSQAAKWLRRASDAGRVDWSALEARDDMSLLRDLPEWQALRSGE